MSSLGSVPHIVATSLSAVLLSVAVLGRRATWRTFSASLHHSRISTWPARMAESTASNTQDYIINTLIAWLELIDCNGLSFPKCADFTVGRETGEHTSLIGIGTSMMPAI
jgi:hypothetical protein